MLGLSTFALWSCTFKYNQNKPITAFSPHNKNDECRNIFKRGHKHSVTFRAVLRAGTVKMHKRAVN